MTTRTAYGTGRKGAGRTGARLLVAGVAAAAAVAGAIAAEAGAGKGRGTLLVLNKAEASASLIDLDTGAVVATLPTGQGPHEAAVDPEGRFAVVTNYGTGPAPGSSLTVIDMPAARVTRTIDLGSYRRPHGVAWLPDGRRVAVTAEANKALLVVDARTGKVEAAIDTGQEVSHMVALSPDGARAYVANIGSGSVSVIDLKARTLIRNLPTGDGAEGIALSPGGGTLWVTNRAADTVSVIDTKTLAVAATLPSADFPIRAATTPDGRHVLVSNAQSGDLAVFDAARRVEARRIKMERAAAPTDGRLFGDQFGASPVPVGVLVHPDGREAYVANTNADAVAVIDLADWSVRGWLKAGREPDGMAFSARRVKGAGGS